MKTESAAMRSLRLFWAGQAALCGMLCAYFIGGCVERGDWAHGLKLGAVLVVCLVVFLRKLRIRES